MKIRHNLKSAGFFSLNRRLIIFCILLTPCNALIAEDDIRKELRELKEQFKKSTALIKELSNKVKQLEKNSASLVKKENIDEERVEELEEIVSEIEEKTGNRALIHAFEGIEVNLGGFIHSGFTYINGENGDASSFNRQNFELLISAQLNENWSAFFAGGFLRESDDPFIRGSRLSPKFNNRNKTPEIISWVNYKYSDAINLRAGRFLTPHGIINIEHFPGTLLDPEQPQFLRPFSGNTLFANFSTGLHFHGNQFIGDNKWSYNAYVSNFTGNPEDEIYGLMTEYTYSPYELTGGISYAHGTRSNNSEYDMGGFHVLFDKDNILWKNEFYITTDDRLAFYTQPAWRISSKWIAFYRFDFLHDGISKNTENVVGINFLPYPNIRLRATYTYKDFGRGTSSIGNTLPAAHAHILQMSGTFSF